MIWLYIITSIYNHDISWSDFTLLLVSITTIYRDLTLKFKNHLLYLRYVLCILLSSSCNSVYCQSVIKVSTVLEVEVEKKCSSYHTTYSVRLSTFSRTFVIFSSLFGNDTNYVWPSEHICRINICVRMLGLYSKKNSRNS